MRNPSFSDDLAYLHRLIFLLAEAANKWENMPERTSENKKKQLKPRKHDKKDGAKAPAFEGMAVDYLSGSCQVSIPFIRV